MCAYLQTAAGYAKRRFKVCPRTREALGQRGMVGRPEPRGTTLRRCHPRPWAAPRPPPTPGLASATASILPPMTIRRTPLATLRRPTLMTLATTSNLTRLPTITQGRPIPLLRLRLTTTIHHSTVRAPALLYDLGPPSAGLSPTDPARGVFHLT